MSSVDNVVMQRESMFLLLDDTERLGYGSGREVYACRVRPELVVKLEAERYSFQNIREWEVWQSIQYTPWAKWFAPCESISPNGSALLQRRTTPVPEGRLPDRVPVFLTDLKPDNFGMFEGRVVCHDYGNHLMLENGMTNRMKKAQWR